MVRKKDLTLYPLSRKALAMRVLYVLEKARRIKDPRERAARLEGLAAGGKTDSSGLDYYCIVQEAIGRTAIRKAGFPILVGGWVSKGLIERTASGFASKIIAEADLDQWDEVEKLAKKATKG